MAITPSQYSVGPGLQDMGLFAQGGGRSSGTFTAAPGGGQLNATLIQACLSVVSAATAADSVMMPPARAGEQRWISNMSLVAIQIFGDPRAGDTIQGAAGSTGISLPSRKTMMLFAVAPGAWQSMLSA